MNDTRQITFARKLKMSTKNSSLHIARRKHTKIIQPKLTYSHYFRLLRHLANLYTNLIDIGGRVVWMYTGAREYHARMCLCQGQSSATRSQVATWINHASDATSDGRLNHSFAISVEAGGVNVGMAIDEQAQLSFRKQQKGKNPTWLFPS